MTTEHHPVLLYDGHCALCNSWVRIFLALDSRGELRFAALQSEVARQLLQDSGIDGHQAQSVVLVENSRIHARSDAVLAAIGHLGSPWKYLSYGRFFPRVLRDVVYDFIAANRYAWFGRYASCPLPAPEYRDRFLDLD